MVIIPYYPVRDEALKQIIRLKLGKIQRRLKENHKIELTYDDALLDEVASRCTEVESGARNVDNILTNTLLPEISRRILGSMAEGEKMSAIHVESRKGWRVQAMTEARRRIAKRCIRSLTTEKAGEEVRRLRGVARTP